MGYEPKLIAPFQSGLVKYFKPWIIGNDAFADLQDAYTWRGSVRKREGTRLLASLPLSDKPVMGLKTCIVPSSLNERLIAFSKTKAYQFDPGTSTFVNVTFRPSSGAFSFQNGDADFFWTCNYANAMFETTYTVTTPGTTAAKGINFYNPVTQRWSTYQPLITGTTYLNGCLIILPYKGRLVALSTIEGTQLRGSNVAYQNRARWCARGTPYTESSADSIPPSPFSINANAWNSDASSGSNGGFIDADTTEQIISADIVKDTLIVFFQRSTWRLRYTGNEISPFVWERLNTQFGAEATFSNVAFDDGVIAFSRYGWISSDTNNVQRIDQQIPDDAFSYSSEDSSLTGLKYMQSVRDFYRQFAYWTYRSSSNSNNKIYAYNYIDKQWAIYNPSVPITCFGTYKSTTYTIWSNLNAASDTWKNYNSANDQWQYYGEGQNINFPFILGGDADGNVYQMFELFKPITTDNGTAFNFNITTKDFNPYIEQGLKCRLGYVDIYCTNVNAGEIILEHYINNEEDPINIQTVVLYKRGTVGLKTVSYSATTTIFTTQVPHTLIDGQNVTFYGVQGNLGDVLNGGTYPVTIVSATVFSIPTRVRRATYIPNTGVINFFNLQDQGSTKYTRVYLGAIANFHQIKLSLSPVQLADPLAGIAQFELQGLLLWTRPTGRIRG